MKLKCWIVLVLRNTRLNDQDDKPSPIINQNFSINNYNCLSKSPFKGEGIPKTLYSTPPDSIEETWLDSMHQSVIIIYHFAQLNVILGTPSTNLILMYVLTPFKIRILSDSSCNNGFLLPCDVYHILVICKPVYSLSSQLVSKSTYVFWLSNQQW